RTESEVAQATGRAATQETKTYEVPRRKPGCIESLPGRPASWGTAARLQCVLKFFKPRSRVLNSDPAKPKLKKVRHGNKAAAVRHGHDYAVRVVLHDEADKVLCDGFARDRAIYITGPSHNFDTEFGAVAKSVDKPRRSISGAEHVDAF